MAFRKGLTPLNPVYPTVLLRKSKRKIRLNLDNPTASPKDFLSSDFEKILKKSASPMKFCPPDVQPNNERAISFFSFEHSLVRLIFLPVHLGTRSHILCHLIKQHLLVRRKKYLVFLLVTCVYNLRPLTLSK